MSDLLEIRVGGVPEHFNLPWHLAIEDGRFEKAGLNVSWKEYPGGTGAMNKDLRSNDIDITVILTAGLVRDVINGNPSRIIQQYITTPLIWGAHCAAGSSFENLMQLRTARFAISRQGSGSHLITYLLSKQMDWKTDHLQFVETGGLEGTRESFGKEASDCLLWEKYTTKPLVDAGEFKRVGEVVTPWPCFVIAGRQDFIDANMEGVKKLQEVINSACADYPSRDNFLDEVAKRYQQKPEDVEAWFATTKWATDNSFNRDEIFELLVLLNETGMADRYVRLNKLVAETCELV